MACKCDKCGDVIATSDAFVRHWASCSGGRNGGKGDRAQPTSKGKKGGAARPAAASASSVGGGSLSASRSGDGNDSDTVRCPECGDPFTRRFSLKRHAVNQHPDKDVEDIMNRASKNPNSKCPHCGSVITAGHLQRHINENCPQVKVSAKQQAGGKRSGVPREVRRVSGSQELNVARDSLVERAGKKPKTNPLRQQASNTGEELPANLSHLTASISGAVAADFPITPDTMDSDFEIKKEIKMEIKEEPSDD